jgi:hypothetical protein
MLAAAFLIGLLSAVHNERDHLTARCAQASYVRAEVSSILEMRNSGRALEAADLRDTIQSYDNLSNQCQASIAQEAARLLMEPELQLTASQILYGLGRNARVALPLINRAYQKERAWMRKSKAVDFISGPDHTILASLRCLRKRLITGAQDSRYCYYLELPY